MESYNKPHPCDKIRSITYQPTSPADDQPQPLHPRRPRHALPLPVSSPGSCPYARVGWSVGDGRTSLTVGETVDLHVLEAGGQVVGQFAAAQDVARHHLDTHQPITAVADALPQAICPHCGGAVTLRSRQRMNGTAVYFWRTSTTRARHAAATPTSPNSNPALQPRSPKPAAGGRPRPAHSPLRPHSPSGEEVAYQPTAAKKEKKKARRLPA
ncbi:MAG: hypothetical protein IPM39_28430 [Chloroflexi bacterium]|nr:hypothetical protein [Chloroflexota bacterium]